MNPIGDTASAEDRSAEQPLQELSTGNANTEGPDVNHASAQRAKHDEQRFTEAGSQKQAQAQSAAASSAQLFAQGGHAVTSFVADDASDSGNAHDLDKPTDTHINESMISSTAYTELD